MYEVAEITVKDENTGVKAEAIETKNTDGTGTEIV